MLRRRIFSSAMASVMALSTVAVVAQAEETKAVKTEAELDALVNGEAEGQCGPAWRSGELLDYGATQTEQMLDALDAAEAILYNDEATEDDYTVAWYMVTGVRESLKKYTYDDLQKLMKKVEPKFAKNNIYNEELNDNIYDTTKYGNLESAYGDAQTYSENSLVPDITEAYVALEKALDELIELPKVTKAEFRAVMNEYEAILADAHKYDSWRRGTLADGGYDWYRGGSTAFGYVYDTVIAAKVGIVAEYDKLDAIKGLNITTDVDIRAGYDLAQKAIACYKSWTPDTDSRASGAAIKSLIAKYNGVLVHDFMSTDMDALVDSIVAAGGVAAEADMFTANNGTTLWNETTSSGFGTDAGWCNGILIDATAVVQLDAPVYVPVDKDGKWVITADVKNAKPTKALADDPGAAYVKGDWLLEGVKVAGTEVVSYKMLSANSKFDLADYIKVEITDGNIGTVKAAQDRTLDRATDGRTGGNAGNDWKDPNATWAAFYGLDSSTVTTTKVDLVTALVIAQAYVEGTYANILPSATDAAKLAKEQAQETAFDVYFGDDAVSGLLYDAVDNAADPTSGLTDNLIGKEIGAADDAVDRPDGDPNDILKANDIMDVIDESGVLASAAGEGDNGKGRGHYTEWQVVYRYLKYALSDCYDASAQSEGAKYTWADVNGLVAKATELIDKTGDAAIFNPSNVALVTARQVARDWLADAKSDRLYKEYTAGVGADGTEYVNSTQAYTDLFTAYDNLVEEYDALKISFEEVYAKIADTTAAIDKGDLNDSADLQDAIKAVARALSNIDDITYAYTGYEFENNRPKEKKDAVLGLEYEDNAAFDGFREFLAVNRVVTGRGEVAALNGCVIDCNDKQNPTHKALVDALAALDKAIEKASEPEVVVVAGDYDGNGVCDLDDASAMIAAAFTAAGLDQTKGDFDGDGDTDLDDVSAIIAKEFAL